MPMMKTTISTITIIISSKDSDSHYNYNTLKRAKNTNKLPKMPNNMGA